MGEYVNSTQVQFNKSFVSCGVLEAHHLPDHTPPKLLFAIATALYHKANPRPAAFVLFSDVVSDKGSTTFGRGESLANYIKNNNFGHLMSSPKSINPRTGNLIQVWVLCMDHDRFRAWYQDELANRIDE